MPWSNGDDLSPINLNSKNAVPVYNIKDPNYGATGDGTTIDTTAIQAADTAASVSGLESEVFFPPGVYATNATLTISDKVSWIFAPGAKLLASGSAFGPMVKTEIISGFGNRYGRVVGMRLDGNDIATQGLFVSQGCVQRYFESVDVRGCTSQGLIVSTAQNNTFIACHSELNGNNGADDANLVLDLGAGNNVFVGCEFSNEHATTPTAAGARYNILILESDTAPGGFAIPTGNQFVCCRAERISTSSLAAIEQRAGRNNVFNRCDIQTYGSTDAIRVDSSDGVSNGLRFADCFFGGEAASSTVARCTGTHAPALVFEGMNFWENFAVGFAVGDDTNVELFSIPQGTVTDFILALGSDTDAGLVVQRLLKINGAPSSATAQPPGISNSTPTLYDGTNHRVWAYDGAWRFAACQFITSPSALDAGDNDDYNPGAGELTLRLSANASGSTITGISGGLVGRRLRLMNVSGNVLTLSHQDAGSSEANRILSPSGGDIIIGANHIADLEYDSTIVRWRITNVLGTSNTLITTNTTTPLSISTAADFNDMTENDVRVVFASSGLSLGWSSGASLYDLGSGLSEAQPTS